MNTKIIALLIVFGLASTFNVAEANVADDCKEALGEEGKCRGYFERYTFDGSECKKFVYGGCGGSRNNFETLDQCQAACGLQ